MCCWRLPPLPPGDDVLRVLPGHVTVATLSAAVSFSLPGAGGRAREESKPRTAEKQPLVPHAGDPCGQKWKIIPDTRSHRGFFFFAFCLSSCGQKSEKQAGMREGLALDRSVQLVLIPLHVHLLFLCVFLVVTLFYPVRCRQARNAGTRQQCNGRFSQNNLLFRFLSVGTRFLWSR